MSTTTHPIDRQVGELIRDRRKELGLSQTALAEALGVTFQQVQKYENGSNRISASRLVAISEALSLPVAVLLGEAPPEWPRAGAQAAGDEEATRLLNAFRRVSPAEQRALLQLVETMAEASKK